MNRIQVLSKHISNQIAAGEVVDRPAAIVKELTENAIDAGSTSITVEISGGGAEYIRISDDGSGIMPDDVPTAFLRHATSKISTSEDLAKIGTLGFRGEALSSIAAVAQVAMRTRVRDAESGTLIRIDGGEMKECRETGCATGTSIEVRNLFYNVPARLKFLKSPRSEAGYISDYVSRAIMARPDISFRFINGGKTVYHSSGDGDLKNAIYCIYGSDVLPHLKQADYYDGRIKITGFVGSEQISRPNRLQQSLYVNSRYIKSQQLAYGIQRAFDSRIMSGKFPFFVLHLSIDPEDIDVNVHPNKMEIRFKDEQGAVRAATIAARMALGDPVAPIVVKEDIKRAPEEKINIVHSYDKSSAEVVEQSIAAVREMLRPAPSAVVKVKEAGLAGDWEIERSALMNPVFRHEPAKAALRSAEISTQDDQVIRQEKPLSQDKVSGQVEFGIIPYSIIGQLFSCYWVVQQGNNVFFIDQHAAHERRLYERLMNKSLQPDSQMLLIPMAEKLTPLEFDILMENIDRFTELGFEIEEFGPLTIQLRAVPAIMAVPEGPEFIHQAIGLMENRGKLLPEEAKREALIQHSCKHAVKAGAVLQREEIEALLKEYEADGVPMTCPHGRPVMVQMSKLEFEKLFKRVL